MFRKKQLFSLTLFIFSHFIIGHPRNFNCINAIALHPLFARSATFPPKGISVLILEYFIWWRMFDHLFSFFPFGIFYLLNIVWSRVFIFDFGIFYLVKNVWSPVFILEYFIWWWSPEGHPVQAVPSKLQSNALTKAQSCHLVQPIRAIQQNEYSK